MDNASTEVSLSAHSSVVKEVTDHLPVVLFKKYSMYAYKPVPVLNISPAMFIGVITILLVRHDWFLLIKSRYLRCRCSFMCFNVDKLREVMPLRVVGFTIRSYTRNYILYWVNTYFGMSISIPP